MAQNTVIAIRDGVRRHLFGCLDLRSRFALAPVMYWNRPPLWSSTGSGWPGAGRVNTSPWLPALLPRPRRGTRPLPFPSFLKIRKPCT